MAIMPRQKAVRRLGWSAYLIERAFSWSCSFSKRHLLLGCHILKSGAYLQGLADMRGIFSIPGEGETLRFEVAVCCE